MSNPTYTLTLEEIPDTPGTVRLHMDPVPKTLLDAYGLDASDPDFLQHASDVLSPGAYVYLLAIITALEA